MQTAQFSDPGTAATTVVNIMAGSKFEFLARPAQVRVYAVIDTTAAIPANRVILDLSLGNVVVGEARTPAVVAVDTGPFRNENLLTSGQGAAGDRIQIRLQNPDALAQPTRVLVDIIDLA